MTREGRIYKANVQIISGITRTAPFAGGATPSHTHPYDQRPCSGRKHPSAGMEPRSSCPLRSYGAQLYLCSSKNKLLAPSLHWLARASIMQTAL